MQQFPQDGQSTASLPRTKTRPQCQRGKCCIVVNMSENKYIHTDRCHTHRYQRPEDVARLLMIRNASNGENRLLGIPCLPSVYWLACGPLGSSHVIHKVVNRGWMGAGWKLAQHLAYLERAECFHKYSKDDTDTLLQQPMIQKLCQGRLLILRVFFNRNK